MENVKTKSKNRRESFLNSMTGLRSTGRSIDMHKAWIDRSVGRSMLHEEEEPSWPGRPPGRLTFPVSPVTTEGIEQSTGQSTVHLGRSTSRSTDSRVKTDSGPELFWGFLLLLINRGCNPFLGLRDFWWELLREPIIILLYLVKIFNRSLSFAPRT